MRHLQLFVDVSSAGRRMRGGRRGGSTTDVGGASAVASMAVGWGLFESVASVPTAGSGMLLVSSIFRWRV